MKTRNLKLLAVVTVLMAVSAMLVVKQEERAVNPLAGEGEKIAPALEKQMNDIRRIVASDTEVRSTLTLGEDNAWRVEELNGYPADLRLIRQTLYRLSVSTRMEKKTANPDLLSRIGLSDRQAKRIQLFTALPAATDAEKPATPVADLLAGTFDETFKGTYIRVFGDTQSWLASGDLTFYSRPVSWADPVILTVDRARIRQVKLEHKGQAAVAIERDKPAGDFVMKNIPVGMQEPEQHEIYGIGGALESMRLANVAKADKLPKEVTTRARFLTIDGLEVLVEVAPEAIKGQHWATLSARYVPEAALKDEDALKIAKKPEEVVKEVETINARTHGWIYKLQEYPYKLLMKQMGDLVKPKSPTPNTKKKK